MEIGRQERNIFLLVVGLIFVFAYIDQSPSWLIKDREEIMRYLWVLAIAGVALTYYFFKRDKSESLGIFVSGFIMLQAGLLDFFYFTIFKLQGKVVEFCVNNDLNTWVSANIVDKFLLNNPCTTYLGLGLNSAIGIFIAYKVFIYLRNKW